MSKEDRDREYVECCRRGDLEAYGFLVEKYQGPVFNAIAHMVRDPEDARELCQQVFVKAFQHLDSFAADRRFIIWIYRMAINESINHLKARRPLERIDGDPEGQQPSPKTEFETREAGRDAREMVMALDPEYRAVVILRHFLHCSYADAAEILEIPEKTVKSRLFTARQRMREALTAKG